jgi:hypothetical protein
MCPVRQNIFSWEETFNSETPMMISLILRPNLPTPSFKDARRCKVYVYVRTSKCTRAYINAYFYTVFLNNKKQLLDKFFYLAIQVTKSGEYALPQRTVPCHFQAPMNL